jgi:hypothetical protein
MKRIYTWRRHLILQLSPVVEGTLWSQVRFDLMGGNEEVRQNAAKLTMIGWS